MVSVSFRSFALATIPLKVSGADAVDAAEQRAVRGEEPRAREAHGPIREPRHRAEDDLHGDARLAAVNARDDHRDHRARHGRLDDEHALELQQDLQRIIGHVLQHFAENDPVETLIIKRQAFQFGIAILKYGLEFLCDIIEAQKAQQLFCLMTVPAEIVGQTQLQIRAKMAQQQCIEIRICADFEQSSARIFGHET